MIIRRLPQGFDDFKGGSLLALQTIGIDGVDDGDGGLGRDFLHQTHAVVEVTLDLQNHRPMSHGLCQFAQGDLAFRDQDKGGDAGARGIGCRRGGGVAGGGADDGPAALGHRLSDRHGHAAVLEGTRGVESFEFGIEGEIAAQVALDVGQTNQRRLPFAQAHGGHIGGQRQAVAVFVDQSGIAGNGGHGCLGWKWGECYQVPLAWTRMRVMGPRTLASRDMASRA